MNIVSSDMLLIFSFCQPQLLAATKFIAHLVNQLVAHEVVALELLTVLLENPTDDSVEVNYCNSHILLLLCFIFWLLLLYPFLIS